MAEQPAQGVGNTEDWQELPTSPEPWDCIARERMASHHRQTCL